MAAHTGTMQVRQGLSKVWLAIVAFAVAAALVIALVAMQGGSQTPDSSAKVQTQTHLNGGTSGAGDHSLSRANHLVCSRCAP